MSKCGNNSRWPTRAWPIRPGGLAIAAVLLASGAHAQGPPKAVGDGLLGKALSAAQQMPAPQDEHEDVETVIVKPDAFAESDHKLEKVLHALPGSDDAAEVKRDMTDKVKDYFARRADPNALDDDTKKTMLRAFEPANNNP